MFLPIPYIILLNGRSAQGAGQEYSLENALPFALIAKQSRRGDAAEGGVGWIYNQHPLRGCRLAPIIIGALFTRFSRKYLTPCSPALFAPQVVAYPLFGLYLRRFCDKLTPYVTW